MLFLLGFWFSCGVLRNKVFLFFGLKDGNINVFLNFFRNVNTKIVLRYYILLFGKVFGELLVLNFVI